MFNAARSNRCWMRSITRLCNLSDSSCMPLRCKKTVAPICNLDLVPARTCKQARVLQEACGRRRTRCNLPAWPASGLQSTQGRIRYSRPTTENFRRCHCLCAQIRCRSHCCCRTRQTQVQRTLANNVSRICSTCSTAGATRYSIPCRQFSTTGSCSYGSRCRFSHTATPATPANSANPANPRQCTFCGFNGHTSEVCRKRLSRERNASHANNSVSLLSSSESALNVFHLDPAMLSGTPNPNPLGQACIRKKKNPTSGGT